MTSSTDMLASDPFPSLDELLEPAAVERHGDVLADLRARSEAEGFDTGYERGYAEGIAAGRSAGLALVSSQAAEALARIESAFESACAEQRAVASSLVVAATEVALQIAEAVIGRELEIATDPGRDALVRALNAAPDDGRLVARLNPGDADVLSAGAASLPGSERIEIVADPSVEPGGCLLDTPTGRVDALVSSALARAGAALRGSDEESDR